LKTIARFILSAVCSLFCLSAANAQESNYTISNDLPGITGVTVYTGAPPSFDPTAASDVDLQTYGYPRRPDAADKKAFALWRRAIATTRVTPELVPNPERFHRPNQQLAATSSTVRNTTKTSSGNWSGYSLVGGSPTFDEVVGLWIVPNIGTQSESFTGYSSMWVGIDGNCTCNDLIQDGTEQDWVKGKAKYDAWIEFIPEPEVLVKNFPIQPGDVISAYSEVGTKNGVVTGFYFIANFSTNQSVSASLAMPAGDTFSGKSAEWIFERTEVNGSFQNPLPYYAYAYMDNAWAYRSGSTKSIDYLKEANQNITMEDTNGTSLSQAYEQDTDSMWFQWLAY
jgi:Peptidase A4 family